MRSTRLAVVLGIVAALLIPGAAAAAEDFGADDVVVTVPDVGQAPDLTGDRIITNAQLRWGLNDESGGAAFAGGCNFLSAGRADSIGTSRLWTEADGLYRAAQGTVRIEKPTAAGDWTAASWQNRCLDPEGNVVTLGSVTSTSGNQVVIDGGTGSIEAGTGLEIAWRGSFTVVFYGGMTYWSATDPVLKLDVAGNGRLTAVASGYGASMDDTSKWNVLPEREIVLADIRAGRVVAQPRGLTATPEYRGVNVDLPDTAFQVRTGTHWGAFPQSFVDYHHLTGQSAYWFSSGGVRDAAKPASALYVSFDAGAPVALAPPPPSSSADGSAPVNSVRLRPSASAATGMAAAAVVAAMAGSPLTFLPEGEGLVPGAVEALLSPAALPLLGATLALLVAILSVLNMMGLLPWQQGRGP